MKESEKTLVIILCFLIAVALYLLIATFHGASSA
ncbi:hypothetical protein K378_01471 [Streptomyces sp. Amel2xB2]|nr:hypothetical protein K378_01471 [Streptomyces sp. Amel2xB2]